MKTTIDYTAGVLAALLTTLIVVQIAARTLFNSSLIAIEELTILTSIWLFSLGALSATMERKQIAGGLTELFSTPTSERLAAAVIGALTIATLAVFLYFSIQYCLFLVDTGRNSSYLEWPTLLWAIPIPWCFGVMILLEAKHLLSLRTQVRRTAL